MRKKFDVLFVNTLHPCTISCNDIMKEKKKSPSKNFNKISETIHIVVFVSIHFLYVILVLFL